MVAEGKFDRLEKLTKRHRKKHLLLVHQTNEENGLERFYDYFTDFDPAASDEGWENIPPTLVKWALAYPESPTPLISLGFFYVSFGWKARGTGYADTVTGQGWTLLHERVAKAKIYLEKAAALPIQDPNAYVGLIDVAQGLDLPREYMEAAYERGVALEPNYLPLYLHKATYLLPRWHGARGEWETWLKKTADAVGGEDGDILYKSVAHYVADVEGEEFFHITAADYSRMKRGFEVILARYGQKTPSPNLNALCYFACIASDRTTAENCFQRIGNHWVKGVWGSEANFNRWHAWAFGSQ